MYTIYIFDNYLIQQTNDFDVDLILITDNLRSNTFVEHYIDLILRLILF